ncbi:hypothetical protein FQN49_000857 [Arthroderma sp. PD_2]|nr:hypothetical protein FQN49_000857 [Arthroderma sp. PD_2]
MLLPSLFAWIALFCSLLHPVTAVGPTCRKLQKDLGDRPGKIFRHLSETVCQTGCKRNSINWDQWIEKEVLVPGITKAMKDMGVPEHTKNVIKVVHDVAGTARASCGKIFTEQRLCKDPDGLAAIKDCLVRASMPVTIASITKLAPLLQEPICVKAYKYLMKDDLWDKMIPKYITKHTKAVMCKKRGLSGKDLDTE